MGEPMLAWVTKYVFRVLHIGPMVFLSYKIILDYINDTLSTQHSGFFAVMGLLTAIAGLVNTFLLKPKTMGEKKKLWMMWHHIKFIVTLALFSPIYKYIISDDNLVKIRFYFMFGCLVVSPFMRFYREYHVGKNNQKQQKKQ